MRIKSKEGNNNNDDDDEKESEVAKEVNYERNELKKN